MEIATIAGALAPLALLACPLGMGVMMWMMGRGMGGGGKASRESQQHSPGVEYPSQPASLEVLREEHQRLSAAIDRLEHGSPTGEPEREQS